MFDQFEWLLGEVVFVDGLKMVEDPGALRSKFTSSRSFSGCGFAFRGAGIATVG
jgi:hypothetical protein